MKHYNYSVYVVLIVAIVAIVSIGALLYETSASDLTGQAFRFGSVNYDYVVRDIDLPSNSCTDTDYGHDYVNAGAISGYNSQGTFNYPDACVGNYKLREYYCNQYGYPKAEVVNCTAVMGTKAECTNDGCKSCVIQITKNDYTDQGPDVHKNYVVWHGFEDASVPDIEIFVYNIATGNTRKITSNTENFYPKIYAGNIVWQQWYANGYEIMLHNIYSNTTTRITNNNDSEWDPLIHKDIITWDDGGGSSSEVSFYDIGLNILNQMTNNIVTDIDPNVHDGIIVWQTEEYHQDDEIAMYNNNVVKQITFNDDRDEDPVTNGQYVVWNTYDGDDYEIYMYDIANDKTIQITDDDKYHHDPAISGNYIVWDRNLDFNSEIQVYEISTGNRWEINTPNMDDFEPVIEGNLVVWSSYDSTYDIKIKAYDLSSGIMKTYDPNFTTASMRTMHGQSYKPAIDSDYNIVWFGWDGNDWEIYLTNFNWC